MQTVMEKEVLKDLLKEAIIELLSERKEEFIDLFSEVLEDFLMAEAIKKGLKTKNVTKEEVIKILKS